MDSFAPPSSDFLLAAIAADPVSAADLIATMISHGHSPSSIGLPGSALRALPLLALRAPLLEHGHGPDQRDHALRRLTDQLSREPDDCDAWLEGLIEAGLGGSPETPSPMGSIASFYSLGRPLPSRASVERWIEAGLLYWKFPSKMPDFNAQFPGVFAGELGARVFSRFLPNAPARHLRPPFFTPENTDNDVVNAMVECGALYRLAPAYAKADRRALIGALISRVDREARRAAHSLSPLPCLDPVYPELLAWANARLARGQDRVFEDEPLRAADFYDAFGALALSRCAVAFEADAIALASRRPATPASLRRGAL